MKIAVIGAGSLFTSELLEGIQQRYTRLPLKEITLMDISTKRLSIMAGFCRRYISKYHLNINIKETLDVKEAVLDANFVIIQIRAGGNKERIKDEKIPLSYGLVGQETTGAGGFFYAIRQVPEILKITKCIEEVNPDAWVINYSNPAGIVTEAILKYSKLKAVGLCAGGEFPKIWTRKALHLTDEIIEYDYVGLNHLSFAYNIRVDGRLVTRYEMNKIISENKNIDPEIGKLYRALLSPYLWYYYQMRDAVEKLQSQEKSRAENVLELERKILQEYESEECCEKSLLLKKRGGGGYSDVALNFMEAVYEDKKRRMIVNTYNDGVIPYLEKDACVEIACIIDGEGIHPIHIENMDSVDLELIYTVKKYEQMTVMAAVARDKQLALKALMTHPLVRDYKISKKLLEEERLWNTCWE